MFANAHIFSVHKTKVSMVSDLRRDTNADADVSDFWTW